MTLWNRGYTTDYISDQFVQQTRCKDGKITLNGNTFNVILVPQCQYMPVETLEKLAQLAKGGATILLVVSRIFRTFFYKLSIWSLSSLPSTLKG